jgi:predicted transcriptional regulator
MQVSIYLKEEMLKKIDRLAKREHKSRSKIIEALVESSLKKSGDESRFESLIGSWKDDRSAQEIVKQVYKSRERNHRSERLRKDARP